MGDYEFNQRVEKDFKLLQILNLLKKREMSIAELQREVNLKRSTLIYYIRILESQGIITSQRIEQKRKGRPTILTFNKGTYDKNKEEIKKKIGREEKEIFEKISKLPESKEILEVIKNNPNIDLDDLLSNEKIKNYARKFQLINWLRQNKMIKEAFFITDKGLKYLNERKS